MGSGIPALFEGKYWWMEGNPTWFLVFDNLFRKTISMKIMKHKLMKPRSVFKVVMDSKTEIYGEYHLNDAKQNIRDLLLDSDHSRAVTIGLQKVFKINADDFCFQEWTQMEQTASRLLRNAGSWYEHGWTYDGYTNEGEVLGAGIGPGSIRIIFL